MLIRSMPSRLVGTLVCAVAFASSASAFGPAPTSAPEIDGPAGLAALALLASAGVIAYRRWRR